MSLVIGMLRIVLGIAALGLALGLYLQHRAELPGNAAIPLDYYGYHIESQPPLVVLGILIIGLIGALALGAGLHAVTHRPPRRPADGAGPDGAPTDKAA